MSPNVPSVLGMSVFDRAGHRAFNLTEYVSLSDDLLSRPQYFSLRARRAQAAPATRFAMFSGLDSLDTTGLTCCRRVDFYQLETAAQTIRLQVWGSTVNGQRVARVSMANGGILIFPICSGRIQTDASTLRPSYWSSTNRLAPKVLPVVEPSRSVAFVLICV